MARSIGIHYHLEELELAEDSQAAGFTGAKMRYSIPNQMLPQIPTNWHFVRLEHICVGASMGKAANRPVRTDMSVQPRLRVVATGQRRACAIGRGRQTAKSLVRFVAFAGCLLRQVTAYG